MILQALTRYYERKSAANEGELPPFGFESKIIPVIVEINQQGHLVQLRVNDKTSSAAQFIVPHGVKRASGIAANLFWDNAEYALGIDTKGKPERVAEQHAEFVKRIEMLPEPAASDQGVQALLGFFADFSVDLLKENPHWEFLQSNPNVSFQLQGDSELICQRAAVINALRADDSADHKTICVVTGQQDEPTRLHTAIKGVWGAQSSGANIVSFNLDAFNSFGKSQGLNAPVGKRASFYYTTALNHLLRKGSEQRFQVGDASTVFWSAKRTDFENDFAVVWGSTPTTIKDDPDKYTNAVKAVFNAPYRGSLSADDSNTEFYVLGLAPNAARIAVRFWQTGTVAEFAGRTEEHFRYLEIVRGNNDLEYLPLFLLLVNVAVQGKSENIPPNLGGEVMQSILSGRPYPYTLFAAAIRRCKAEQRVNYSRAAIIKAYLNRFYNTEELKVALDEDNTNTAYRLGRLFATLEKIQEDANPKKHKDSNPSINATIRERYYSSASSNPVAVFPTLLKLTIHHLAKLRKSKPQEKKYFRDERYFETLLREIINDLPPEFPASLALLDQGRFAIGYYHQRQDLFTKKTVTETGEQL